MLNYIRKKMLNFYIGTGVVQQFLQTARDTINAHEQIGKCSAMIVYNVSASSNVAYNSEP